MLEAIKIEPKNACDESNSDPSRLSLCEVLGHFSLAAAKIGGAINELALGTGEQGKMSAVDAIAERCHVVQCRDTHLSRAAHNITARPTRTQRKPPAGT
ncbi:MAG TPA: hypothetical protein VJ890_00435 [Vineibacter sp.]|nr:hypothetical protein [Vineibacter sp.]